MADLLTPPAAAEPTAPKPVYTVTDLGTLEGGSTSIARDINDSGQVVGQSQSAEGNRAFLWKAGQGMENLGVIETENPENPNGPPMKGTASFGRGINDSGQVVGYSRTSSTVNPVHGFLWESAMTDLRDLQPLPLIGYTSSEAWSINDDGVAVGRSFVPPAGPGRAVLWENGQTNPEDLSEALKTRFSETAYSEAWSINDDRQVVGEVGNADQQGKAFLYENEKGADGTDKVTVTDIDAAGRQDPTNPVFPYKYSEAAAINDHGQVVGWSYRTPPPSTPPSGPEGRAFLYEKGEDGTANVVTLDPLEGDPLDPSDDDLYSRARDINESGRIVGWSRGTDGNERQQFSAVLWQNRKVTDLNTLIPANSRWRLTKDGIKGWTLTDAYAINASGQIVGAGFKDGKDASLSQLQAFLLTPDTTKPKIECGTADGDWHDEDVSISCTASDDGGVGLADPTTDASFTLTTSVPDGTETADARTDSRQVCDAAGNCATAGPIGGNKVDKKAPAISISTSPGGDEYELGDDVTVSYDCTDGGSGTASCSGPAASGGKLDTASVGQHIFTVESKDEAGNVGSKSIVYQVIYDFGGFFSPVDNPEVLNKAKAGSTVPVKFSLSGDRGIEIFEQGYPKSETIACDPNDQVDAIEQTLGNDTSHLTYDATTDQYTYVWKTNKDWTGCRQLVVKLNDGKDYRANFKFVK